MFAADTTTYDVTVGTSGLNKQGTTAPEAQISNNGGGAGLGWGDHPHLHGTTYILVSIVLSTTNKYILKYSTY